MSVSSASAPSGLGRDGHGCEAVPRGNPGLGQDVVEDRRGVRVGRLAAAVGRVVVEAHVRRLDLRDLLLGERAPLDERPAQAPERVERARGGELLGRAVELLPVGVRVRADPHALRVDERAARPRLHVRDGLAHRAERVEEVLAVAMDDLHVQKAREVVRREAVRSLVALRDGDPVAVVLDDEDDRELLARRAVDGLVEIPLRRGRLADGAEDDRGRAVRLHGATEAGRVLRVVRDARGDVLDVDRGLREVVRHVPAARRDVVSLRHAVQEDLVDAQAGGDACREVAVIGKEVVHIGAERDAERDLDPVVARAGRVIGPAEALLEVVRGLVVQDPREVHERVPLPQLVAARSRGGGGRHRTGRRHGRGEDSGFRHRFPTPRSRNFPVRATPPGEEVSSYRFG